jgi:hypothetical protein
LTLTHFFLKRPNKNWIHILIKKHFVYSRRLPKSRFEDEERSSCIFDGTSIVFMKEKKIVTECTSCW